MATAEEVLEAAGNADNARSGTVRILLRQGLFEKFADGEQRLQKALEDDVRENRVAQAPGIADELEALGVEVEDAKVPFRFRAIGARRWADLLRAHPPTPAQIAEYKALGVQLDHNPDTFHVAAVAATLIDPKMDESQVAELEQKLNVAQFNSLWFMALDVMTGGTRDPKSLAAGLIRRAKRRSASSATAADEESLEASSSDE